MTHPMSTSEALCEAASLLAAGWPSDIGWALDVVNYRRSCGLNRAWQVIHDVGGPVLGNDDEMVACLLTAAAESEAAGD